MDPQRIEEFRRKLREGRPAKVVNGQVTMADAAPPKPPAPGAAPEPGRPQGVEVMPHEWGAAGAPAGGGTPEQFYATDEGVRRALKEQAVLTREYPGFVIEVDDDGTPYAHGWIGPTATLRGRYHVLLTIPPGYGQGAAPSAFVLEPELRTGAPHLFSNGSLCLDHSAAFTGRATLVTYLAWVSVWLVLYEGWADTGTRW